jgi:GalNAc-alpha-(1->4)-GalNAc-alpha-(1->3)-diNAcBac-PP-undecaprenol alpha-1,4-N-acetyl-D-galactosaminyltransferase
MHKKKTVLLVDTMSFGGSERTVQILANNQDSVVNDFIIVSLADIFKYTLNDDVERRGIYNKNFHPLIKLFLLPITIIKLAVILKNIKSESVISFHQQSHLLNVIISKFLSYKPIISERAYIELYYGKKNKILRPIIKLIYNNSSLVIVNDIEIKESLIGYYKIKTRIEVINNLLDISNFKKQNTIQKQDTKTKFITIGRLSKEKNTKDLIIAFKKANIKNSQLEIIGDGSLLEPLKLLCSKLEIDQKVIFHGHQTDIGMFLQKAHVFVFSSLNEGFPNVVLEAMYFGLPIISYKFKAGITTILENGKHGVLVPLNDVNELSRKMKILASDKKLRRKFERLSKARVKYFTKTENYIRKYNLLINNVYES